MRCYRLEKRRFCKVCETYRFKLYEDQSSRNLESKRRNVRKRFLLKKNILGVSQRFVTILTIFKIPVLPKPKEFVHYRLEMKVKGRKGEVRDRNLRK
jgi:hypothetical protein